MTTTVMGWSDGGSACEYYRLRVPLDFLHERGDVDRMIGGTFKACANPITGADQLPDVVIGQRVNRPDPARLWRMLADGSLGSRPRLVYELDDDLFNVAPSNPVHSHYSKRETRETILECMSLADVITVSTAQLAGRVTRELWSYGNTAKPIVVIPNALPHIAYRHDKVWLNGLGDTHIGWAGSTTHEEDFDEVAHHLGRFMQRNPDTMFRVICSRVFLSILRKVPPDQIDHIPWVRPMPAYYQALDAFDVGIIPLRPSLFNQSKSDLKFLEYAARRIPVIASNCGPYEVHNAAGRSIPATGHEWLSRLDDVKRALDCGDGPDITQAAFDYAWSRRVDTVADAWLEVITNG